MWLTYGVDTDNALVAISDVPSGKTHLRCLYCGGPLTAKKGHIVGHHFAHTGETCRAVERDDDSVALPLYDLIEPAASRRALARAVRRVSHWLMNFKK